MTSSKKKKKKLPKRRIPIAPPSKRHKTKKDYKRKKNWKEEVEDTASHDALNDLMLFLGDIGVDGTHDVIDEVNELQTENEPCDNCGAPMYLCEYDGCESDEEDDD